MTTLRKAMPFTLLCAALLVTCLPLAAQNNPDCSFTHQFTGDDATWIGVSNLSGNTPCVNWRITFSVPPTDTLTTQVTIQTSPDRITWTAVPNTLCAAAVQPPCLWQGTNPTAADAQGMIYAALYGNYVRVITSGSAGAGTVTVRAYGAKGATANANIINGPGTGTVTNFSFTGGLISVANPTTAPALTVAGTSGGIVYFPSASTWASSGALTQYFAILGGGAGNPPTVSTIKDDGTAVTINQNSVVPFTSVAAGAVANTLYLNAGRLGIGTAIPMRQIDQQESGGTQYRMRDTTEAAGSFWELQNGAFVQGYFAAIRYVGNVGQIPGMVLTTASHFISGGYTEGNYQFDVQGSGTSGTARYFDQTPTTGTTLVTITPGAAQTAASTILNVGGVAAVIGLTFNGHACSLVATVVTCP